VMSAMLSKFKLQLKGPWLDASEHALVAMQKSRLKADKNRMDALSILQAAEFKKLFETLSASISDTSYCMLETPPKNILDRLSKLSKKYRHWQDNGDEAHLHEVRITFKKLRYTCEIYETLYGEEMQRFIKKLKHHQETLGEWNDWRMLREEIESVAHTASYRAVQGFPLLIEQIDVQCKRRLDVFILHDKEFHALMESACKLLENAVAPCCHWKD